VTTDSEHAPRPARSSEQAVRPWQDRLEIRAPGVVAFVLRLMLQLPASLRSRVLTDAFARAERAFNRGDFAAVFALFTDDAEYVPPPALHSGPPIIGRLAAQQFWGEVLRRFERSTITNLSLEEATPSRFIRIARLTHDGQAGHVEYTIRQVTEVSAGRVTRQVNAVV
jgi:ketosteroid isomerase-like protein